MCLFNLGAVVATPPAIRFCSLNGINPTDLIARHHSGDWGDLDEEDVKANVSAIQHDLRIFSSYTFPGGKLWVITEADRSSTCLMTPECY